MTTPDTIADLAEGTVPLEEQVRRERVGGSLVERVARATRPSLWEAVDKAPESEWSQRQAHLGQVWAERAIRATLAAMHERLDHTAERDAVFEFLHGFALDAELGPDGLAAPPEPAQEGER
jgi:hypothetical protein